MKRLMMVALAAGGVFGLLDVLIRLTPLDGSFHWFTVLTVFVIMPAMIVGLAHRLKDGAAPLVAAGGLAVGHLAGMAATWWLVHGFFWDELFTMPLLTLPPLIIAATLTRMWTRKGTERPAQVSTSEPLTDFNQARKRARERLRTR